MSPFVQGLLIGLVVGSCVTVAYFWELRYRPHLTWYYSLDVPSGCVWRSDLVTLTPRDRPAMERVA